MLFTDLIEQVLTHISWSLNPLQKNTHQLLLDLVILTILSLFFDKNDS